jgi:Mce-associated membrane protein
MTRARALIAAIVVLAAVAGYFAFDSWRTQRYDNAAREALAAAPNAATALFSYDYRSFDASVTNGRGYATGTFATEYAHTTAALKDSVVKEQAVVTAKVSATGLLSASADKVEVLLYLDQHRRNVTIRGEKVDRNRIVLTFVRVSGAWKVSAASPL